MKTKTMWMVRAEVGGKYFEEFKAKSIVAIGWLKLGDMSPLTNREAFIKAVTKAYPENKKMHYQNFRGCYWNFVGATTSTALTSQLYLFNIIYIMCILSGLDKAPKGRSRCSSRLVWPHP